MGSSHSNSTADVETEMPLSAIVEAASPRLVMDSFCEGAIASQFVLIDHLAVPLTSVTHLSH